MQNSIETQSNRRGVEKVESSSRNEAIILRKNVYIQVIVNKFKWKDIVNNYKENKYSL